MGKWEEEKIVQIAVFPIIFVTDCRHIEFLEKNELIYKHQFSFQRNNSTTQTLFYLNKRVADALNKRNYSCNMFLDLAKTFGTVD